MGASADDQDAAMNWLESLAANQGAKPEELITDPNARTESAPEWVEQAKDASASAPPVAEAAPLVEEADTPVEETSAEVEAVAESLPVIEETPEMPDLAILEAEETEIVEPELPEEVMPVADKTEEPPAEEDLPTWLADMSGSEESEKVAEVTDEPLPDWMKAEEESTQPQPTQAAEWQPAETASEPEPVEEEKSFAAISGKLAKESIVPRKGDVPKHEPEPEVLPQEPVVEKKKSVRRITTTMLRDKTLMSAQAAIRDGDISAALVGYGQMIKKKRLLDEVIYDLREALDDHPVDVSVWQMLGDAYMRGGQLQEAIDAYTNAEKLLR